MKAIRKYLCCVLHVHISIENSLLVGNECIGKCESNQHFIFNIHSQRVFYATINSNKPKLKQLIYIQSFGSFLGFDPFRLQILFENRKIIKQNWTSLLKIGLLFLKIGCPSHKIERSSLKHFFGMRILFFN